MSTNVFFLFGIVFPKYIFFAVLEHEGKSDEDILRIMGISESTLRSTRSRINSKKC